LHLSLATSSSSNDSPQPQHTQLSLSLTRCSLKTHAYLPITNFPHSSRLPSRHRFFRAYRFLFPDVGYSVLGPHRLYAVCRCSLFSARCNKSYIHLALMPRCQCPSVCPSVCDGVGVGGCSEKNFHRHTYIQTHTRHPDYLSRASQHARGANKNSVQNQMNAARKY